MRWNPFSRYKRVYDLYKSGELKNAFMKGIKEDAYDPDFKAILETGQFTSKALQRSLLPATSPVSIPTPVIQAAIAYAQREVKEHGSVLNALKHNGAALGAKAGEFLKDESSGLNFEVKPDFNFKNSDLVFNSLKGFIGDKFKDGVVGFLGEAAQGWADKVMEKLQSDSLENLSCGDHINEQLSDRFAADKTNIGDNENLFNGWMENNNHEGAIGETVSPEDVRMPGETVSPEDVGMPREAVESENLGVPEEAVEPEDPGIPEEEVPEDPGIP
ncbi:hypothetical protein, partial [Priestia megaterium]|uniref:hypothetical protein n=1 Tax=Priestia megaterium TaxID=1404 RepID=UPI003397A95F